MARAEDEAVAIVRALAQTWPVVHTHGGAAWLCALCDAIGTPPAHAPHCAWARAVTWTGGDPNRDQPAGRPELKGLGTLWRRTRDLGRRWRAEG